MFLEIPATVALGMFSAISLELSLNFSVATLLDTFLVFSLEIPLASLFEIFFGFFNFRQFLWNYFGYSLKINLVFFANFIQKFFQKLL